MKSRTVSIELWRLLFAISIVFCHGMVLPWFEHNYWCTSLGVEFFFVIAGYFMMVSIEYKNTNSDIATSGWMYLSRRIKSIYPTFFFAAIFNAVICILLCNEFKYISSYEYIWDMLFMRGLGLGRKDSLVGASWYLDAMFLAMFILFPIICKCGSYATYYILPLLCGGILGWFYFQYGNINYTLEYKNIFCLGVLRAIAEISAGCIAYGVIKILSQKNPREHLIGTLVEVASFLGVFYIQTNCKRGTTDFLAIILLILGVVACFSGISQLSSILEKVPLGWVSDFSKALYLNHYVWVRIFQKWKIPIKYSTELMIYVFLSILTALTCVSTLKIVRMIICNLKVRIDLRQESYGQ